MTDRQLVGLMRPQGTHPVRRPGKLPEQGLRVSSTRHGFGARSEARRR